jgi:TRAP-type C4-dicarboxylate transport system permease large subunit
LKPAAKRPSGKQANVRYFEGAMSKFANFTSIIPALVIGAVIAGGFRTMVHSGGERAAIANAQTKLAEVIEERCAQANLNLKVCHCVVERTLEAIPAQEMVSLVVEYENNAMPEGATKWIKRALYDCDR